MKLSMAVAGAAIITLLTVGIAPVYAAVLDFRFTTSSGATGSFTLDTDTPPSPEPSSLAPDAPEVPAILYPRAVSNYSFSSSYLNFNNDTADWIAAPSLSSGAIGLPANLGVFSGVNYPSGCVTGSTSSSCLFALVSFYSGNVSQLPVLSDNSLSYSSGLGVSFFDAITQQVLIREDITNFQVVRLQPIPESNFSWSVLAFGIGGIGLVVKPKMSRTSKVA